MSTHCKFFVQRKKRHCKFLPLAGEEFCAEHLPRSAIGEVIYKEKKRVPCPYDPNHTVFESKLQSHLKKCNSKPIILGDFHINDINSGAEVEPAAKPLSETPIEELMSLVDRLKAVYDSCIGTITEEYKQHTVLTGDINNPEHQKCLKHRKQEASLLGHMESSHWLADGSIYVEFGAGRARLTTYLMEAISDQQNSHFILIDRDHARNKCENKYKDLAGPSFERIRIDIKDIALDKHEALLGKSRPIIAFSKHLCGAATDLTLRCMERLVHPEQEKEGTSKRLKVEPFKVKGIQIALCCHHRCSWQHYVGKKFWEKQGFTSEDFITMRALSGWATCAFQKSDEQIESRDSHHQEPINTSAQFDEQVKHRYHFWNVEEREEIGRQAKRVIDAGRMDFLEAIGFDVQLIAYVPTDVSLENIMLKATMRTQ